MDFSKKCILPCVLFFAVLFAFPLYGQTDEEGEEDETAGVKSDTLLTLQLSSLPEAKLIFTQSFTIPFLQGENPLVKGNNIRFDMKYEVTPISMGFLGDVILTPIAFLQFSAGGLLGSGWNIELFGSEVRGMGLNVPEPDAGGVNRTSVDGSPFGGTFVGGHLGGTFQFDLAAVVPGDWNHVVVQTNHDFECKTYNRAGKDDSWFYESDHGENQNGWIYYSSYVLGYQMPVMLNMVALLAERYQYLYNTPNSEQWGGDVGRWDFGLVMNFKFSEKFSTALITQFRLYRSYSNFEYPVNIKDKDDPKSNVYYRDRIFDGGRDFEFYRVAAILNYRLR